MKLGLGQSALRVEDMRFLRGRGRYSDDITLPSQAWSYLLRAPRACPYPIDGHAGRTWACWRSLPKAA